MWDARQEDKYGQVEHWLHTIETLGEDSPVILILNKCDERIQDINLKDLEERFSNIKEFYSISCKCPEEGKDMFDKLIKEITKAAWELPLMGTPWSQSWLDVRSYLESLSKTKNQLEYIKYLDICKAKGIEEEAANVLSGFLHDLGVMLHFQKDPLLKHTIILNPEWGTRAVYKVLDTKTVQERRGIFLETDRANVWKAEEGYPYRIHETLVRLMSNFDLAFEMVGTHDYLVAELLPMEAPEFEWDNKNNLIFQYQYNFMPAGVMPRFIVKIHDKIERDTDGKYMWTSPY
ncbi:MAG: hypothetical protein HQK96_05320 [Nitrospirae bacterium]|nr:hypothetical protein [Nitrospirota bacterium]